MEQGFTPPVSWAIASDLHCVQKMITYAALICWWDQKTPTAFPTED